MKINLKKWCTPFVLFFSTIALCNKVEAQEEGHLFKGHFYDAEERVDLHIDLYSPTLEAPGMEFLGKIQGYIRGNIYGIWLLTSHRIKDNVATLRFSNDTGGDAQTVELTAISDSLIDYRTIGGNNIKRIEKRKLVKIPNRLHFKLISK